jgi:hypothetical protein
VRQLQPFGLVSGATTDVDASVSADDDAGEAEVESVELTVDWALDEDDAGSPASIPASRGSRCTPPASSP